MFSSFAVTLLLISSMAHAPTAAIQNVQTQITSQRASISAGIREGSLSRTETRILKRKHLRVSKRFRLFLRDRVFTKSERRSMHRLLKRSSLQIFRYRHNRLRHRVVLRPRIKLRRTSYRRPVKVHRHRRGRNVRRVRRVRRANRTRLRIVI